MGEGGGGKREGKKDVKKEKPREIKSNISRER